MGLAEPSTWFRKKSAPEADPNSIEAGLAGGSAVVDPQGFPSPRLPSLNLVPDSRTTLLSRRKATKRAVMIGGVSLAACSGTIALMVVTLFAANAAKDAAEADRLAAAEAVTALQPVSELYDGFEQRQTAVANALAGDVDYYGIVTDIQDAILAEIPRDALMTGPEGEYYVKSDYDHLGLSTYTIKDSPCPTDVPFESQSALGCFSGTAVSSSYATAGAVMRALNEADNGLFGGYVLSSAIEDPVGEVGTVTWSFTINFDTGALSHKYDDEARAILGLDSDEDVAISTTPAPSASPTASEGEN